MEEGRGKVKSGLFLKSGEINTFFSMDMDILQHAQLGKGIFHP